MYGQRQEQILERDQRDSARQLKITLFVGVVAFGITLAVILGNKMNQTAASVITGVVAGVAASIPTTFILMVLWQGRRRNFSQGSQLVHTAHSYPMHMMQPARSHQAVGFPNLGGSGMVFQQPPVIVVTPSGHFDPQSQYQSGSIYPNQMPVLTPAPREFQVIGEPGYYIDEGY